MWQLSLLEFPVIDQSLFQLLQIHYHLIQAPQQPKEKHINFTSPMRKLYSKKFDNLYLEVDGQKNEDYDSTPQKTSVSSRDQSHLTSI